jgi:hypothetical protein
MIAKDVGGLASRPSDFKAALMRTQARASISLERLSAPLANIRSDCPVTAAIFSAETLSLSTPRFLMTSTIGGATRVFLAGLAFLTTGKGAGVLGSGVVIKRPPLCWRACRQGERLACHDSGTQFPDSRARPERA